MTGFSDKINSTRKILTVQESKYFLGVQAHAPAWAKAGECGLKINYVIVDIQNAKDF